MVCTGNFVFLDTIIHSCYLYDLIAIVSGIYTYIYLTGSILLVCAGNLYII